MKVGLGYRGRMRDDLSPAGQEIDLTHQALTAWREGQHTIDGAHTDITADTLEVAGQTSLGGPYLMPRSSVLTPPYTITADQNDYDPRNLGVARVLRLTTDASRTFTGMKADKDVYRVVQITNVGNFDIVLSHNDTASKSIYRFACPLGTDVTIGSAGSVTLWYDANSSNWRIVGYAGDVSGTSSGGSGATLADGDYGDVTVSSSGTAIAIDSDVVTFAKMQNIATDRLIGRDTASSGDPEEITVGGGLEFTGSGGIQIANDGVTYARIQNVSAADRLLGRGNGGGSGDTQEISLGTGLSMTGTTLNASAGGGGGLGGVWSRVATWTHSGDVTEVDFPNLSGYSEILVSVVAVTLSVSGLRQVRVSTDNGSTFLSTSGDYMSTASSGVDTAQAALGVHATSSTTAASGQLVIRGFNVAVANKPFERNTRNDLTTGYIPTASALNAIRIIPSGGGNLTGGTIDVWGRA